MKNGSKTVTLTGATGFVGAAVLRELISADYRTIVLLRNSSDTTRLDGIKEGFESLTCRSLKDKNLIQELRKKKPGVFLQMAWAGVAGEHRNEVGQIRDNLPLTIDSVELAAAVGCAHWVGMGSHAEYGNQNRQVNEESPLEPSTMYGKAKVACCWTAMCLCQAHGLKGTWLRLFDPYGPGDNPTWLLPYLMEEMSRGNTPKLTRCEQLWDYLYIDDVARAIKMVVEAGAEGIYNLGSGKAVPLTAVVKLIRKLLNPDIQSDFGAIDYRPDQVMHLQADISKLTDATGWAPTIGLEEGFKKTIRFFLENK